MKHKRSSQYLLDVATEVQTTPAIEANAVCYIPRAFSSIPLPARKPISNEYTRKNGRYQLQCISPSDIGLPYGTYARFLIIYIATQAKLSGEREITLGRSMAEFMRAMGVKNSGGRNGSISSFKDQAKRLFTTTIILTEKTQNTWKLESVRVTNKVSMIWEPMSPSIWEATLTLDETFFTDILQHAVPIDNRVIHACSHYPLALDSYCWLTHRYFRMSTTQRISWEQLSAQFANCYSRQRMFKDRFIVALDRVRLFYPNARFSAERSYLVLYPSPPHVPTKRCG